MMLGSVSCLFCIMHDDRSFRSPAASYQASQSSGRVHWQLRKTRACAAMTVGCSRQRCIVDPTDDIARSLAYGLMWALWEASCSIHHDRCWLDEARR